MRWVVVIAWAVVSACRTFAYETIPNEQRRPRSRVTMRAELDAPATGARVAWQDIAVVRHRRQLGGPILGGLFGGPAPPAVAPVLASATPTEPENLVIEAWIDMQADDVAKAAATVRARIAADGGRIVSENMLGAERAASSVAFEIRIPPAKAVGFTDWLDGQGTIESRRVMASDVGKILFDQALALENLELAMARLQELAKGQVDLKELLELEKELTRVRGEIEKVKGEQRWLVDRVEFATIELTITREPRGTELASHGRLHVGPRLSHVTLLDPGGRPRARLGGGATVRLRRYLTLDLDIFPRDEDDGRIVIATAGTALYSSFLGYRRRTFLNPFLGARAGYGSISGESAFVAAGELGVELFRHRYVLADAGVRAVVFFRDLDPDVAFHAYTGFAIPF
jgi:hypothetical protein